MDSITQLSTRPLPLYRSHHVPFVPPSSPCPLSLIPLVPFSVPFALYLEARRLETLNSRAKNPDLPIVFDVETNEKRETP